LKNTTQARFGAARCAAATMQCIPVVLRRDHSDFDRCPGCGHCIQPDGTVLPAVFTSVSLGVRRFTRNLKAHRAG
jgi:hypothetical protein